jgi:hypothetical protein
MRSLRFLPLAFIAGIHGFALFAAYAAVVLITFGVFLAGRRFAS